MKLKMKRVKSFFRQYSRFNGTFIDPTKFLCFPVSKIHRKMELYVLQEFAIWLLLLINIHLFYKTVKKCLFSVGTAADTEQGYAPIWTPSYQRSLVWRQQCGLLSSNTTNPPHSSLRGLSPQDRFFSEPEQIRRLSEEDIRQNFLRRRNPKL